MRKKKAGEEVAEAGEKQVLPFSFPDDPGSNNSGFYQLKVQSLWGDCDRICPLLQAVLTHKGRSSSSGHYVAWVKTDGGWAMCDDDHVLPVDEESVLKLSGGGDWHCAYLLLYGPRVATQTVDHVTPTPVDS
jgi:ubiquitin carboxyl-terminal hydrolase 14